jgi:DNA-binding CsgD family transcriptional regulator
VPGDLPPLRGRETELDLLRRRLLSARQDGRGRVVVVSGAPGSGKSRLLREARVLAGRMGARILELAGDPDENVIPHGAVLDAVQAGPDPLLDRSVLDLLPTGAEQGWWLRQELQSRLEQVAIQQPVLVSVDDLQYFGAGTLRLLRTLPPLLAADAVVWVVVVRSGSSDPAVTATVRALTEAGADNLELRPLDREAVALLVGDVLGALPDESVLRFVARAEGHPLLLVEMLRGWREEGLIEVDSGRATLVGDVLPSRMREAVGRRTERLSTVARELLQIGAVLGRRFPPDLLAAMLDRPPPAVLAPLQEVMGAGLWEDDGESIGFEHDLVREAVVAGIPAPFVRVLRRHAVDVLLARGAPTVQVATMLAESAVPGDLDAVAALREAAATLGPTASPAAADFSVRALELLPEDSPLRAEVVVETVMLLWQCGRATAAQRVADTMLTSTSAISAVDEARVRLGLAEFATRYSAAEALRQCRTALALPDVPADVHIQLLLISAVNHSVRGDADEADAVLAPVIGMLDEIAESEPRLRSALARIRSFVAFHRGDWDAAFEQHEVVTALLLPGEDSVATGVWAACLLTSVGHPERALAVVEPELAAARRDGRLGSMVAWSSLRVRALLDAARLEEAQVEGESALDLEDIDLMGGALDMLGVTSLVRVGLHAGRPDIVRAQRERVERMTVDENGQVRRNGLWLTALIAEAAGDVEAALAATEQAWDSLDSPRSSFTGLLELTDDVVFVRLALRAGRADLAARAVRGAQRRAATNPSYPLAAAAALHARGLLHDDENCLREAVHLMVETERPLLLASAREDLARRVAGDRPREAIALLDDALAAYTTAGAEHDAARVRRRLRDLGVRRRRTQTPGRRDGLAALTPAELDVVRLVADGGTNRQVAEELYVSPHTVNTHLRNAFTKLGVRSRLELARRVAAQDSRVLPS